jgi:hypothetical protein
MKNRETLMNQEPGKAEAVVVYVLKDFIHCVFICLHLSRERLCKVKTTEAMTTELEKKRNGKGAKLAKERSWQRKKLAKEEAGKGLKLAKD